MIRFIFVFMLAVLPEVVFSQDQTSKAPEKVTKIVRIQHGDPRKIADLVDRPGNPIAVRADNALGVIVLNGLPEFVTRTEQTIKELDVAPAVSLGNDVELIVYMVGGSNNPTQESAKNPAMLEPVIKQLGSIFPYKNYQLLGTMLLRSQQGKSAANSGVLNYTFDGETNHPISTYRVQYNAAGVSSERSKTVIHLNNFLFEGHIRLKTIGDANKSQYDTFSVGTQSDVDIREGQKVVVGKTDVANDGSAIFIVLTAKLVN